VGGRGVTLQRIQVFQQTCEAQPRISIPSLDSKWQLPLKETRLPSNSPQHNCSLSLIRSDWPPGTITLFGYNMHLNLTKLLINLIPFALLAVWQFHFGQLYIWFPASFASQYHPDWTCQTVQVPGGGMCEDVVLWKEFGFALLTCDSNRRKWNTVMVLSSYYLSPGWRY
jgi:hypothetical protein